MTYSSFGVYGPNPHYTLAETPYARMTGMFTPMSESAIPGTSSYLQPTFIDMNPYFGNTGVPRYPSFIGGMAMMNPQIPLAQPGYTNYPPQQQYYQQPAYGGQYGQYGGQYGQYSQPGQYAQYGPQGGAMASHVFGFSYGCQLPPQCPPPANNCFSNMQGFNQWIGGLVNGFMSGLC